jgi:hypothetical protein
MTSALAFLESDATRALPNWGPARRDYLEGRAWIHRLGITDHLVIRSYPRPEELENWAACAWGFWRNRMWVRHEGMAGAITPQRLAPQAELGVRGGWTQSQTAQGEPLDDLGWRALSIAPWLAPFLKASPGLVLHGFARPSEDPIITDLWAPHRWLDYADQQKLLGDLAQHQLPVVDVGYYIPDRLSALSREGPLEVRYSEERADPEVGRLIFWFPQRQDNKSPAVGKKEKKGAGG